jgi:hypothetical protein
VAKFRAYRRYLEGGDGSRKSTCEGYGCRWRTNLPLDQSRSRPMKDHGTQQDGLEDHLRSTDLTSVSQFQVCELYRKRSSALGDVRKF